MFYCTIFNFEVPMKKLILFLFLAVFIVTAAAYSAEKPKYSEKTITVQAYAYCYHSRTATGSFADNGTIAVDPKVIPLGSKIYVPGYGWGKALDTGGAIKGNKIDIWFPTERQCYSWGVRTVKIKVVAK